MATQVLGRRLHIAVMLLALGVGLLVAFSKRYGWPLFLVMPVYGLVGTVIVHRVHWSACYKDDWDRRYHFADCTGRGSVLYGIALHGPHYDAGPCKSFQAVRLAPLARGGSQHC